MSVPTQKLQTECLDFLEHKLTNMESRLGTSAVTRLAHTHLADLFAPTSLRYVLQEKDLLQEALPQSQKELGDANRVMEIGGSD